MVRTYRHLLPEVGELRDVSLRLLADVADQAARAALQLADALVAQLGLLLQLRGLQLQRGKLAQELPVHGHQLLEALLQRFHVRRVALPEGLGRLRLVGPAQRVELLLQLHHLRDRRGHSRSLRSVSAAVS